jgi:DNA topoisomerase I
MPMAKKLVIVESPAKAKTIEKFLGRDFEVRASMGHIIDLPKKGLGVEIRKNFAPKYEVIEKKDKLLDDLKAASRRADEVFLAPDPDREGEFIAWSLKKELDLKNPHRAVFHEIKTFLTPNRHAVFWTVWLVTRSALCSGGASNLGRALVAYNLWLCV